MLTRTHYENPFRDLILGSRVWRVSDQYPGVLPSSLTDTRTPVVYATQRLRCPVLVLVPAVGDVPTPPFPEVSPEALPGVLCLEKNRHDPGVEDPTLLEKGTDPEDTLFPQLLTREIRRSSLGLSFTTSSPVI